MQRKHAPLTDTDVTLLIALRRRRLPQAVAYHTGFLAGYLTTLANTGVYALTSPSFEEGYRDGVEAYVSREPDHVFPLSEICEEVGWSDPGKQSAWQAGYLAGFLQSFTIGVHDRPVFASVRHA